jgi:hypothetical protein
MNLHEKREARGRERRAHPRAPCDCSITIQLDDGPHRARLRDVSRAGLCFFLDRPVPEMTLLSVRIDLPAVGRGEPGRIDGRGVVVRCQPISRQVDHYEVAVFLNELSQSERDLLDEFVAAAAVS